MKRTHTALLAVTVLALSIAGTANAQNVPNPGLDDLGMGSADVRDEPDHPDDDNGFPDEHEGDFWSPATETLVLETYYTDTVAGSFNNYVNQALHGNSYDDYEQYIIPGEANFLAYWGWWADTGSGGDMRNHSETADTPLAGNTGDGAIQDNGDDCREDEWDEFTWRGVNECASENRQHPGDSLWVFAQPGTWDGNVNGAAALLNDGDDAAQAADFHLEDTTEEGNGPWRMPNGFGRLTYDQSLLVTSVITTSANPAEIDASKQLFEPHDAEAVDVDTYSALSPELEQVYRTVVWDPHEHDDDQEDTESPVDDVVGNDEGPKEAVKEQGVGLVTDTARPAIDAYWDALDATQRQRGVVENTAGKRPDKHEPNTAGDQFGLADVDDDGEPEVQNWATFDADTSYGGLGDDYYDPGEDQTYDAYQDGAHTWVDAQQEWSVPVWGGVIMGINSYNFHPSAKDLDSQDQDEQNTQAPGLLHQRLFVGVWHDKNQDTWVGDVSNEEYDPQDEPVGRQSSLIIPYERWYDVSKGPQSEENPYAGGTDGDPNDYWDEDEWKGIVGGGNAEITVTLVPDNPEERWGDTGVYFLTGAFNPYSPAVSDALGDDPDPVMDNVRDNEEVGGLASYALPDDENGRLSNYRTHGPIEMNVTYVSAVGHEGHFRTTDAILFPSGSLDYRVKSTVVVENQDEDLMGMGDTSGQSLAGEIVRDVDYIDSMT